MIVHIKSGSRAKLNLNGHVDPSPHPIAEKMLNDAELIDILRYYDDESVITTYKAEGRPSWSRLDRWYSHPDILDDLAVLPNISAPAISDHDIIRIQYGNPYRPDKPTHPIYRMSVSLIKQLGISGSRVRENTELLLADSAALIRDSLDPNSVLTLYDALKDDLKKYFQSTDKMYKQLRNKDQLE